MNNITIHSSFTLAALLLMAPIVASCGSDDPSTPIIIPENPDPSGGGDNQGGDSGSIIDGTDEG